MSKNNIRKNDLSKILSKKKGFSQAYSKKLIQDLIDIFTLGIQEGKLNIKNIGSFKVLDKKERLGRNPKTMETFKIKERKSVSFIASKKLTKFFNN